MRSPPRVRRSLILPLPFLLLILLAVQLTAYRGLPTGPAATAAATAEPELSVEVSGRGPDVVLVPGLLGCAYGYRHVVPALNEIGLRTIVVEPLGLGASPRPPEADYSLTAQAGRVAAVMDRLQASGAIVVAHGAMAGMAMRLALQRPDLVGGIVSLEGGGAEEAATPGVRRALDLAGLAARLGAGRAVRDRMQKGMEEASGDPSWVDGLTVKRYFSGYARDLQGSLAALKAMLTAEEPEPLAPRLAELHCPVILLLGEAPHDGAVAPEEVARLQAALTDLEIRRLPGCGHYVMEEDPAAVVAAVRALRPHLAAASP